MQFQFQRAKTIFSLQSALLLKMYENESLNLPKTTIPKTVLMNVFELYPIFLHIDALPASQFPLNNVYQHQLIQFLSSVFL